MDFMTAKEAAGRWGVTARQIQSLCDKGLIDGAVKFGSVWAIPAAARKPIDGRTKEAKATKERDIAEKESQSPHS
jgi:hypothetical protein